MPRLLARRHRATPPDRSGMAESEAYPQWILTIRGH